MLSSKYDLVEVTWRLYFLRVLVLTMVQYTMQYLKYIKIKIGNHITISLDSY